MSTSEVRVRVDLVVEVFSASNNEFGVGIGNLPAISDAEGFFGIWVIRFILF